MNLRDLIQAADYGAPVPLFAPGSCESHAVALCSGDGRDLEVELTSVGVEYQHCDATMVFVRDVTQRNRSARALAEQVEAGGGDAGIEQALHFLDEPGVTNDAGLNPDLMANFVDFLRRATDEVLAYLQWLTRFAEAEGLTEGE